MKRYLILLFCIFAIAATPGSQIIEVPNAIAWMGALSVGGSASSAVSGMCTSCTPSGYTFCEDGNDTGYRCTWSETVAAGTVDEDATQDANFACTDIGSEAVEIISSANTSLQYTTWDNGSGATDWYIKIWLVVTDSTNLTDGNTVYFFALSTDSPHTTANAAMIGRLWNTGGQKQFSIYYRDSGGGWATHITYNFTDNTQYELYFKWDSATNATIEINGASQANDDTPDTRSPQYLHFGKSLSTGGDVAITYQGGAIVLRTDQEPADCS